MNTSVIVVGGGAIGLGLAWELSRRGLDVALIERDLVGKGASWAASGILPPANQQTATDPVDQLRGLSHQLFPHWVSELEATSGIDCGYRKCGAWYLADTLGERAAMIGMTDYWRDLQIECGLVSAGALSDREPVLRSWANRSSDLAAWWVPDECQLRCPHYLQALAVACRIEGVQIFEGLSVCDVDAGTMETRIRTINETGTPARAFSAGTVVLCGGAWTGKIASDLRLEQSLVPVRGQIVLFKTERPLFHPVINVGHRYLVGRDDGYVLVGSCEEEVGFECHTTEAMIDSLRSFALDICPELREATEVSAWAGLRPMTFDGFPMIGRAPQTDNVYVAAGHFRSGIHLSPGTAVCLADLITDVTPAVDLDAFRVGKQQGMLSAEGKGVDR